MPPCPKSRTLAERASWDYIASLGDDSALELVEINPGTGYGRIFEADYGTPGEVARKLMWRDLPGVPKIGWDSVEMPDLATAPVSRAW